MSEWMGAEEHVNRALEHYERGRWADAEAELRKALAAEPDRGEWQFNLGLTLEAAGRPTEALDCYRRAGELMPEEADPLVAAGTVANRLGRHEEAAALLERAVARHREDDTAYAIWIDSLVCLDRLDDAETVFHLANQSLDECPRGLAAVAEVLIRRRNWRRAEWCLREALRLEPALPRVRARLGAVVAEQGGVERAVQLYLRELRDDPGAIDTQLDYGDLLVRLGRLPEAAERYRRVLELEPANVDAHRGLGRTAVLTGRFDLALLEFELVAKLDPLTREIRLDLAEVLLAVDRASEAAAQLREEAEMLDAGECATDPCRLGFLMLRAGEAQRAIPLLEQVVRDRLAGQGLASDRGADSTPCAGSSAGSSSDAADAPSASSALGEGARGGAADGSRVSRPASDAALSSGAAQKRPVRPGADPDLAAPRPVAGETDPTIPAGPAGPAGRSGESRAEAHPRDRRGRRPGLGATGEESAELPPPRHLSEPSLLEVLRHLALAKFTAGDLAGGIRTSRQALKEDPRCVRSLHNMALAMLRSGHPQRAAAFVRAGLVLDRHDDGLRRLRVRVMAAALWAKLSRLARRRLLRQPT
jgi:tetratricopeptide (TPR) repeat protein